MTHNGKFCQKSGLDWLKMANYCHFKGFSIFSPKMRPRLTRNGQFHPIHNFSHLLPPKRLIFGEIPKILVPGGGVNFSTFLSFHTEVAQNDPQCTMVNKLFEFFNFFLNHFTLKWLKMTHNAQW